MSSKHPGYENAEIVRDALESVFSDTVGFFNVMMPEEVAKNIDIPMTPTTAIIAATVIIFEIFRIE